MSRNGLRSRSKTRSIFFAALRCLAIAGLAGAVGVWSGYVTLNGWDTAGQAVQAATSADAPAPPADGGLVPLDPILVNLAGEAPQGFLRASLTIMFAHPDRARQVQANDLDRARLRAAVVEVLGGRTAASVASPEGRADLKRAIRERVVSTLSDAAVADVLFTDFVVQH